MPRAISPFIFSILCRCHGFRVRSGAFPEENESSLRASGLSCNYSILGIRDPLLFLIHDEESLPNWRSFAFIGGIN